MVIYRKQQVSCGWRIFTRGHIRLRGGPHCEQKNPNRGHNNIRSDQNFKGKCDNLEGHILNCSNQKQADKYVTTVKNIWGYLVTKYNQVVQGPAQDISFALIIWYIAKTIPTLLEFNLYLSRSSSKYFFWWYLFSIRYFRRGKLL